MRKLMNQPEKIPTDDASTYDAWFIENLPRLLGWFEIKGQVEYVQITGRFRDIDAQREAQALSAPPDKKFQIFKEPISSHPFSILSAIYTLKISLLRCAIFGRESTLAYPDYANGLYCFPGFVEQIGRLPKDNEYCFFVAKQWFELCAISRPDMLIGTASTGGSIPAVGCECYIKPVTV